MNRSVLSSLYLVSGVLIGLGGLGHSLGAVGQVHEAFAKTPLEPRIATLILAVWHFAGAAMVALGALVVRGGWSALRGRSVEPAIPVVTGLFYVGYGVAALAWMREPFWTIFVVYGLLAGLSGWALRKS